MQANGTGSGANSRSVRYFLREYSTGYTHVSRTYRIGIILHGPTVFKDGSLSGEAEGLERTVDIPVIGLEHLIEVVNDELADYLGVVRPT